MTVRNAPVSYSVVSPSGGDDTRALNEAFVSPTYLTPGTYQVSSGLIIPDDGTVIGEERIVYEYYDGSTSYTGKTVLQAVNGSGWSSGASILTIGSRAKVRGISVEGFHTRGDWPVDGISLMDASYTRLDEVVVLLARNGITMGATTPAGSIGTELHKCCVTACSHDFDGVGGWGIVDATSGGGFLSDGKFITCAVNGCFLGGVSFGALSWTVSVCRIEQCGGPGLNFEGNSLIMTGSFFDENAGSIVFAGNNQYNTIVGNRFKANGGNAELDFVSGINTRNTIMGNSLYPSGSCPAVFRVASSASFGGAIEAGDAKATYPATGGVSGTPSFYLDGTTQSALSPYVYALP